MVRGVLRTRVRASSVYGPFWDTAQNMVKNWVFTSSRVLIPLQITNGLPYMKMRPHADEEWERLPKTELTSENEWKPAFGVKCFVHDIVCSSDISLLDKMTCLNFREITPKKSNGLGSTAHFFMLS